MYTETVTLCPGCKQLLVPISTSTERVVRIATPNKIFTDADGRLWHIDCAREVLAKSNGGVNNSNVRLTSFSRL